MCSILCIDRLDVFTILESSSMDGNLKPIIFKLKKNTLPMPTWNAIDIDQLMAMVRSV